MSVNSLYPGTTSDVCVTTIIKDKIREYMMGDLSSQIMKSTPDISTSEIVKENSYLICDNLKKLRNQDAVSTTDFGLPSSLDVSIHNSSEPCPRKQDLVTASVRRIGNSLDALLLESKKAAQAKPIKKSSKINQQSTDRLFLSSEQIRCKKNVTLHDICEEYIQFITVNSSAAPDEETVTTTSGNDIEKNRNSDLEIIPLGISSKRTAQISVITLNESSKYIGNSVIKQSVEEMRVNECEKSTNESDKVIDKLASNDSHDGLYTTVNGNMKSSSPSSKEDDVTTLVKDNHEKSEDKEKEPVIAETAENVQKVIVSLSNGVGHDVNEDIEEEEEEEEEDIEEEEERGGEIIDERQELQKKKDDTNDKIMSPATETNVEEKKVLGKVMETEMSDKEAEEEEEEEEVVDGEGEGEEEGDEEEEEEEKEKKIKKDEPTTGKDVKFASVVKNDPSPTNNEKKDHCDSAITEELLENEEEKKASVENSSTIEVKVEADSEVKGRSSEEDIVKEQAKEEKMDCETVDELTTDGGQSKENKERKFADELTENNTLDGKIKDNAVTENTNEKELKLNNTKETANNNCTAVVAGIKRKATDTVVSSEELEQDRDGGISSSSSCSGSDADNAQDCKRIRFDESIFEEDERERLIREFVERSTESSEDITKNCDKLQHEISALADLARAKELEWNSIMRLLKLKEEMLERISFKKRHLDCSSKTDLESPSKLYRNFVSSSTPVDNKVNRNETTTNHLANISNHVSVVPVCSSVSAVTTNGSVSSPLPQDFYKSNSTAIFNAAAESFIKMRVNRPILPKPPAPPSSSTQLHQQQSAPVSHAQTVPTHPTQSSSQSLLSTGSLLLDQNSIIGEGRQGPILDVKSIIADFRSKNPDSLPRRGRRNLPFANRLPDSGPPPRFIGNTALLSMANMALGSGSHVRTSVSSTTHNDHRSSNFMMGQDVPVPTSYARSELQMRHPNIDSLMLAGSSATVPNSSQSISSCNSNNSNCHTSSSSSSSNSNSSNVVSNNSSFQEALVKFAKMNEKRDISSSAAALHVAGSNKGSHLPPPPPYPEVTLHPVLVPQSSNSGPVQNSLLHGILTKSNASSGAVGVHHPNANISNSTTVCPTSIGNIQHRPTTFSPTLARLLTAPERNRVRTTMGSSSRSTKSTLSEILNSKKTRTEVTITPVTTSTLCSKNNSDVVLVDDDDESENADRLIIDEGREATTDSASNVIPADQVPECQGCHKKAAQFVCAGCGNQWYCSRECQVQAWEDHSEMCSG